MKNLKHLIESCIITYNCAMVEGDLHKASEAMVAVQAIIRTLMCLGLVMKLGEGQGEIYGYTIRNTNGEVMVSRLVR